MALTLIANLDPGLQCRNTLNAVIDLVGANHPWTPGSIPYTDSTNDYAQDNSNFFWDATNKLLTAGQGVKLKGSTSGTVTLNTKAVAGSWALTLPDSAGTSGYALTTDGAGVTSWTAAGAGGGTTILSGSGVPADALGAIGDYYVDEDGDVMYGPKGTAGTTTGPDQIAIPPGTTPSGLFGGPIEIGNQIKALASGQIVAARYWRTGSTAQIARTVKVWTTGGTLLGSGSTADDGGGAGWKQITLTTPVSMAVNAIVVVSVDATGDYSRTDSPTFPISNSGDLQILVGHYGGIGTFPSSTHTANFFTDAVFQEDVAIPAWPVAVGSGMSVGAPVIDGVSGSVLYIDASTNLAQDNANFTFNATTKALNINAADSGAGGYFTDNRAAIYRVPNASNGDNWFEDNAGNFAVTGYKNLGTGDQALLNLTTGYRNLAFGSESLRTCTDGFDNTGIGTNSLYALTSGFRNTAFGSFAMDSCTTGENNFAFGFSALENLTTGSFNVAIGPYALFDGVTIGGNVAVGSSAGGHWIGTANSNVAIGSSAAGGGGFVNADRSVFVGAEIGFNLTAGYGSTWFGGYHGTGVSAANTVVFSCGAYLAMDFQWIRSGTWSMQWVGGPVALHLYKTINATDATYTNYERGILDWTATSDVFRLGTQAGGTGTKRLVAIDGFAKAGAAAAGDLPTDTFAVIDDTSAGQTWLVFNKAGTIRKVQLT